MCAIVRNGEGSDTVQYNAVIVEVVCNMRRFFLKQQNSPNELRETIRDYYGMLFFACSIWWWSENIHSYKVKGARQRIHFKQALVSIAILISCTDAVLVYYTEDAVQIVGAEEFAPWRVIHSSLFRMFSRQK